MAEQAGANIPRVEEKALKGGESSKTAEADADQTPEGFEYACTIKELEASVHDSKRIMLNGIAAVAVFLWDRQVYAIDAQCPHQGGKLEVGDIEDVGGFPNVLCPLHGWCFRLKDGFCEDISNYGVNAYETRVLEGKVYVSKKEKPQEPVE